MQLRPSDSFKGLAICRIAAIPDSSYKYKKLDFDTAEIRVLKLSRYRDSEPSTGSLEHISLINPPPYIALSYCWGVGKSYSAFCLDRQSVDITPNLSVAIQQAQNTVYARKTKTFLLWVDAVYL